MDKNKVIVIEWIDAVGKTTIAKALSIKRSAIYYKTPWNVTIKEKEFYDREDVSIKKRFNFYLNWCKEDINIILGLQDSTWKEIICDRFITSTICHHSVIDKDLDVREANILDNSFKRIQILLIADKYTIKERLGQRKILTKFEKKEDLYMKIQDKFLTFKNDCIINTSNEDVLTIVESINNFINNILNNE